MINATMKTVCLDGEPNDLLNEFKRITAALKNGLITEEGASEEFVDEALALAFAHGLELSDSEELRKVDRCEIIE